MKILGISNTKDSGACLIIDGKLVAAVNEERFNREKLTREFPENSIKWILKEFKLKKNNIDALAFGAWKGIETGFFPEYINEVLTKAKSNTTRKYIQSRFYGSSNSDKISLERLKQGLKKMGLDKIPFYFCSHHIAHAYTAFSFSQMNNALVITLDGRGDFQSGSVSVWKRGKEPIVLRLESELDSLGAFYGWITKFLGFTPDRHEGKVTGLAARGNPKICLHIFKKIFHTKNGRISAEIGDYFAPYMKAKLPKLEKILKKYSKEDIAAAAQKIVEDVVINYTKYYLKKTNQSNLAVSGGIFANVLLNMHLKELKGVKNFFVFPHMGDGGISVGAAAYVSELHGKIVKPIKDVYLGPNFSENECKKAILKSKMNYSKSKKFYKEIAEYLDNGKIVGLFQGKMEFGPRALGNRSVLARTTDKNITKILNKRLSRTEFMPFAPITLEKFARENYKNWNKNSLTSYYMTSCYHCSKELKKKSPGVVHIDNTARPQIITKKNNPVVSKILNEYYKISGTPSLVNTSFNLHEEPIVLTPEHALTLLKKEGIDVLAIPPYIVTKKKRMT
tara:strand:+ start:2341 stop:4029 length:1689 start_codon:yes stop_codon:yes gene_type:complete